MSTRAPRPEGFPTRVQALVDRYGSIRALAVATGKSPHTITDWLQGRRVPRISSIQHAAKVVGVDPHWLLHGETGEAPLPLPGEVRPEPQDGRESVLAVAPTWVRWRLGRQPGDRIGILHATQADAISGLIETEEPVLLHLGSYDGIPPSAAKPGEVLYIRDEAGQERLHLVVAGQSIPGVILGHALWTGRTLIQPRRRG